MATTLKTNRVQQLAAEQRLIDGTNQFLSHQPSLPVGSQTMTPTEIVQVFQDRIATGKAAIAADDARKAAVKADRDERTKSAPFTHAFKRIVIGMFLQSPDTLGVFGLQAPKVGKKTAANKAAAAQKTTATKKARGPIGAKQRAKVKGTVPTAGSPQPAPAAPTPGAQTSTPMAPTPTAQTPTPTAPTPAPSPGAVASAPKAGA
jgi:hypothetical protein